MTVFSFAYGLHVLKDSFHLVVTHLKTLVYMIIAGILVILAIVLLTPETLLRFLLIPLGFIHMVFPFLIEAGDIYLYFILLTIPTLFIVPLIYHVRNVKKGNTNLVLRNINMIALHWVAIGCYLLFLLLKIIAFLYSPYGFTQAFASLRMFFLSSIFFLGSLIFEFMLVSVVLDNATIVNGFKRSLYMIKETFFSIIGGIVGLVFMLIATSALLAGIYYCVYMAVFAIWSRAVIYNSPIFFKIMDIAVPGTLVALGIIFMTVYVTFQTLLYLKYKKELEPVENAVPVQER